jgi:hypothetical protein
MTTPAAAGRAGRWIGLVAIDLGLAVLLAAGFLLVGFVVGRDYERTAAIAAEPAAPIVVIDKHRAWRCGADRMQRPRATVHRPRVRR